MIALHTPSPCSTRTGSSSRIPDIGAHEPGAEVHAALVVVVGAAPSLRASAWPSRVAGRVAEGEPADSCHPWHAGLNAAHGSEQSAVAPHLGQVSLHFCSAIPAARALPLDWRAPVPGVGGRGVGHGSGRWLGAPRALRVAEPLRGWQRGAHQCARSHGNSGPIRYNPCQPVSQRTVVGWRSRVIVRTAQPPRHTSSSAITSSLIHSLPGSGLVARPRPFWWTTYPA